MPTLILFHDKNQIPVVIAVLSIVTIGERISLFLVFGLPFPIPDPNLNPKLTVPPVGLIEIWRIEIGRNERKPHKFDQLKLKQRPFQDLVYSVVVFKECPSPRGYSRTNFQVLVLLLLLLLLLTRRLAWRLVQKLQGHVTHKRRHVR